MKSGIRTFISILVKVIIIGGVVSNAWAMPIVWGVNPVSGDITMVDPRTGDTLGSFPAPIKPNQWDTRIGLSIAEKGQTLLYQIGVGNTGPGPWPGPGPEYPARDTLFRLDPFTGTIKSEELGEQSTFGTNGISYQSDGTSDFIFYSHANPIPDIHRQNGFSGSVRIFWGPSGPPNYFYSGALGGDGNGREFGVFRDSFDPDNIFIGEYDPFSNNPDFINTFAAPAFDINGLAFDRNLIYASSASGQLYTLNPDTGRVIRSVTLPALFFPDGSPAPYVFDIAAVPEPTTLALLVMGLCGWLLVGQQKRVIA